MEVITAIAGKIAELTVIPIGRQVGYLVSYKKNLKELEDKSEELKERKVRIEHDVEAEKGNGRDIEDDVLSWQKRVDETLEEVRKLCRAQTDASVWCWKCSFPNLISRHQLGRKVKKMSFTVTELKEKGKFDRLGHVPVSGISNSIFSNQGSEKLKSRNSMKEEVLLALTDPKVSKVGIYGWGGVGKTFLAKEVAKHAKEDKLFDLVAMATISQTMDVERVQDHIAYQLGFQLDEKISIGRADHLCRRIKKMEKNILIILDDLREKIDLDKIGIPTKQDLKGDKLSLNSKPSEISLKNETYQGCKLLLTSRRLDILQKNEIQRSFTLEALNNAESWTLFEDMVGDAIKDADLQKIATQVVERCAGLPVMIGSIAKSLKYNMNIHYWKDVLKNLKRVDSGDMYRNVFATFEFTYNGLEDDEMKTVFLLCGVNGPSMLVSDLLKYAIGLGVFKDIDTIEDGRNRLYRIIDGLKASCLLLKDEVSKTDRVKMHNLVCEVAVSLAHKNGYAFVFKRNDRTQDWPSKSFLERCTLIIIETRFIRKLPQKLDCPNLRLFHLRLTGNCTLKIPDSFFEVMGSLEVLDLIGLVISSLPESLGCLTKLRTLCLDQCILKDMAGIDSLINLEILSFINSSMEEFPSEIGQLTCLRMLDLRKSKIGIISLNILSELTKIEELYMDNASIKWEKESSDKQNESASLAALGRLTSLTTLEIQIREAGMLSRDLMFDKLERYKVLIGDRWEWSGNKMNLRLLKLKLYTSIHLEHGIKALIKRVEDLYLDEVNGISDVLFHLNAEGFPLLKHLHIQNNVQLQHIINTMGIRNTETSVLFPELETLSLHNLNNLVKICHGPLCHNSFRKLTAMKIKSCDQLVYLFDVLLLDALSQLVELEVSKCSSMKRIVLIENDDSGKTSDDKIEFHSLRSLSLYHLPTIQEFCSNKFTSFFNGFKVSFSSLETLKLSSINLEKIWDDDELSAANCIQNLANLIVEDCGGIKHLFSSSVIRSLLKLKHLEISKCEMMEEIITPKVINSTTSEEVQFSKLETMVIKDMKSLKKVWHSQLKGLNTLEVSNCGNLANIFPSDMQRTLGNIETLKVSNCGSLEEIFELTAKKIHIDDQISTQVSQLKNIHLLGLPKLKQIWGGDAQAKLRFHNLQLVWVKDCKNLEYLFPFYIAMHAIQLEHITITNATSMKQIVSDKESLMDSPVKFEFNHLISLVLWNLYELEGFSTGNHSLLCPILRELDIRKCAKLKLFKTRYWSSQGEVFDSNSQVSMQQPLFTLEEVICNLEKLALNSENSNMILQGKFSVENFSKLKFLCLTSFEDDQTAFPYSFLQNTTSLARLDVEWSCFKEIFQDEIPTNEKRKFEIKTRIKKLTLYQLHKLQHISKEGFQIHPILKGLQSLNVDQCPNLKHLVPSSVTFSYLTYLEVKNCNGLIHLVTSSTARSLVKLKQMKIKNCNSLEQVVAKEREGLERKIAFNSLEVLELECLPMIKRFCSSNCALNLQWLEKVVVKQCPKMSIFSVKDTSTPILQEILSKEDDEKIYWEGDLNKTIKKMFMDMVAFPSLKHLKLDEYPELGELWYNQVQPEMCGNLNSLVIHKCDFLSDVLLPLHLVQALSHLEELEVGECDSLEVVFDLTNMDQKEVFVKKTIQLKRITLSSLPKLKHIWKQKSQELVNFRETAEAHIQHRSPACSIQRVLCPNLQVVWVTHCENLEYLFPFYIAMHANQLEQIRIKYARSMKQIVSEKESLMDSLVKFEFKHLISLVLWQLYELEGFFAGNHSLLCPLLRELDIRTCAKLKVFKTRYWSSQGGVFDNNSQVSMQQPLFTLEEVICNLEKLALDNENLNMISHEQFSVENFSKLKFLCLTSFEDDQTIFPYWFLQNITNLEHLVVAFSSFKEIFQDEIPSNEKRRFEIRTRIKKLNLNQLQKLQYICKQGFQVDPILEVLEYLRVKHCSNLKHLVPSSVTFSHLTGLEVENCKGLIHLITSSTARSLVKLTKMKIKNCSSLKQVVAEEREGSEDEIAFNSLEVLELEFLPMIQRFCSSNYVLKLSSLERVVVQQCPRMSIFSVDTSTSMLQEILSKEEDEKIYWEGDLNRTINKMFVDMVAFHSFKHLKLAEYPELSDLWYNPVQPEVYGNLNSLVVHKCDFLSDVLLPLNLVQALSHLEVLEVSECDSLEAVFDLTNMDQKKVFVRETIRLKEISLSSLPKLKHIWKQNFQELVNFKETAEAHIQHQRPSCFIQWVQEHIEGGKSLLCFEEAIVHLPNLETIIVEGMPELMTIWHPFFTSSCLDNLEMMQVSHCEKIENIFPSYMQRAFASLETLMISDCNSVQVIFEFISEMDNAEKTTRLQQLTLLRLIKLKQIWTTDPLANLGFHNLQSVWVENCDNLEYLFPFSIAMHAIQLEDITIRNAGSMKHIVSDKEVILDGPFIFEFNHLASLVLWKLYELEGFFPRNHSVLCPLLRELDVRQCVKLKLFKTQSTSGRERLFDGQLQISTQQSLFTLEEVICNLERLALNREDASMILQGQFSGEHFSELEFLCLANFEDDHATFPYWFLQNITTLNELHVECSSFKEIFQEEIPIDDREKFKIETRIEKLTLNQLYNLQHICKEGFQIDQVLEDLEYLLVQHCSKLKHLVPSTVTCSLLTYLEVQSCNGLIHLITSLTANSLVNLEKMIIRNCNSLEQVVAEDREESKDAIAFGNLCVLELECLPRLKMFCSSSDCLLELPRIYEVVISNCPGMEIFSLGKTDAPILEKVITHKEDEKEQWEGGLNATVTKIFQDMADQAVETTKQEIPNLPSSSDDRQQKENASSTDPEDAGLAKGTQQMGENIETPMVEAAKIALNPTEVCNAEESHGSSIGMQETCDTIKKPSISVAQNFPCSTSNMIPHAATMHTSPSQAPELATAQSTGLTKETQERGENIERPMVEGAKISPSLAVVYNAEGSHESETCPQENLFNQPKILATCDNNEAVGSQEIRESDQHAQKLATTENTGIQERHETIDKMPLVQPSQKHIESYHDLEKVNETIEKPLIQTSQHTQRPATGPDIEESHESKTCPNKDSFNQPETFVTRDKEENIHDTMVKPLIQTDQDAKKLATIQSTEESRDSYTRTPKICNIIKQASISAAQDVSNSTMIPEAAIDPSPSQAPEPTSSPTEKLNIYRNYKEMIDISEQNMPYLEAGVNRHPQVLDWLDTKRRRVFASSTFSLFAEVTCILRTTRKGHLTEDDRSYIIECCTVLEAAGFDVSWLRYVHKCIEECGDAEDMKRKVEETKGQASSLEAQIESMKKELASVKESLVLLLDKARTLDDFIES